MRIMKIMGCFRKQIMIGAFITFCKNFFKMLGNHLFSYINQFENYRLCGIISGAVILLSQGHAAKGRCVPGFLKLPLSGKSVHVSAPQWCRMARTILKRVW